MKVEYVCIKHSSIGGYMSLGSGSSVALMGLRLVAAETDQVFT